MTAIVVGSGAGGVLGAAYLVARPAQHAAPPAPAAPAAFAAAPAAVPVSSSLQAFTTPAAAKPFRVAAVAAGANDLHCLTEAVYFEARGEPERGQQAVAQVVLNRVRHPAFPKTVCGVVHQRTEAGCQFSFACEPEPRGREAGAWKRAAAVARDALHGTVMREVGDATHFASARVAAFAGLLKVARIGEQVFYRFGGHAGAARMFHQTPAPSTAPPLVVASLTETAPPGMLQAQASKPLASARTLPPAATAQAGAASSPESRPAPRSVPAPPPSVTAQPALEPAKPPPAATVAQS